MKRSKLHTTRLRRGAGRLAALARSAERYYIQALFWYTWLARRRGGGGGAARPTGRSERTTSRSRPMYCQCQTFFLFLLSGLPPAAARGPVGASVPEARQPDCLLCSSVCPSVLAAAAAAATYAPSLPFPFLSRQPQPVCVSFYGYNARGRRRRKKRERQEHKLK